MEFKILKQKNITVEEFIEICKNNSMSKAASKLNLHRATFERYAKLLECYVPKQGNFEKHSDLRKINIEDIVVKGLYPQYSVGRLRKRLIQEGLKENKCDICTLDEWNNKPIPLELDHKDGNRYNHLLDNLRIICPNCHAQTETYRGKNIKLKYPVKKKIKRKDRTIQKYFEDRKQQQKEKDQIYIDIINECNIDYTKRGWRIEISKKLKSTPQHAGNFIRKYFPEIWEKAYKHKI